MVRIHPKIRYFSMSDQWNSQLSASDWRNTQFFYTRSTKFMILNLILTIKNSSPWQIGEIHNFFSQWTDEINIVPWLFNEIFNLSTHYLQNSWFFSRHGKTLKSFLLSDIICKINFLWIKILLFLIFLSILSLVLKMACDWTVSKLQRSYSIHV